MHIASFLATSFFVFVFLTEILDSKKTTMANKLSISSGTKIECPNAINADECDANANAACARKVKKKHALVYHLSAIKAKNVLKVVKKQY